MNPTQNDDDFEYTYVESTLGWGGIVIGEDGIGRPMSEPEALAFAIPQWVDIPEHLPDAISIYLEVMSRPEVTIRLAALTAIAEVVRRYGHLPHETKARLAVAAASEDSCMEVSAAAKATGAIITDVLG